ncbi:MAG: prenyltransferase/squalene oxidase repeat-containing protein [Phycisphaeraceae bacterium]
MKRWRNRRTLRDRAIAVVVAGTLLWAPALPLGAQPGGDVGEIHLSPRTERAIDEALEYLADTQNSDGSWGSGNHAATTAMALMAFMLKGHFPEQGRYASELDAAVDFMIRRARDNGGYFGDRMYGHGFATLALSEVWGMSRREEIRDTLKQAVEVILRAQHSTGGWRYEPRPYSHDVSVTASQLTALASAQEAGIYIPRRAMQDAINYVQSCQHGEGGFNYQPNQSGPAFARSAASMMSMMLAGERDGEVIDRGLAYLTGLDADEVLDSRHYYYGHYYAVQAMYQAGDPHFSRWYAMIEEDLLARQRDNGSFPGVSGYNDQLATAMSVLILGVPYRFLPIYQR